MLYGRRRVSVKRTLYIWWDLKALADTVGRVARYASHHQHPHRRSSFQFLLPGSLLTEDGLILQNLYIASNPQLGEHVLSDVMTNFLYRFTIVDCHNNTSRLFLPFFGLNFLKLLPHVWKSKHKHDSTFLSKIVYGNAIKKQLHYLSFRILMAWYYHVNSCHGINIIRDWLNCKDIINIYIMSSVFSDQTRTTWLFN